MKPMEFDEHQLAIVESEVKLGKALIIKATAGSGKTRTVIGKVQRLAMEDVPSSSIVTTAFNNLAARELKDRFRSFKIPKPEVVATLHSFGRYLLYKYFDLKPTVMTEWNSLVLMRDLLEKDFEGYKKSDLTPIAKELVEISNLLRCTRQYNKDKIANGTFVVHKYVDSDLDMKNPDICKYLHAYAEVKEQTNTMDYADMIYRVLDLLEENPEIVSLIKKELKYFFIDESQDLDQMQWDLILLLAEGNYLCCVGDIIQSLYGWRNAIPANFSQKYLGDYYKEMEELTLVNNYRSPANIVNISNIIREQAGDPIRTIAKRAKVEGAIKFVEVRSNIQEGQAAVKYIKACLKEGYNYKDIHILTRSSYYAKHTLEPALVRENIPYVMTARNSGKRLTEKPLNLIYFSAIAVLLNRNDIYSLGSMAEEIKGIGPAFVTKLRKDYITYGYQMPDYSGKDREKLEAVIKLRESVMCLGELMFGTESRRFITELTDTLRNFYYDTPLFAKEKDVLLIERSLLHWFNFYLEEGCPNLKEVMFKVNTELDSFDEDEEEDVISVETVHASKGREYPIVIAAGFNSIREMADPEDEEKNVLYVQFTRAQEKMYVIDSMTYVTQDNRTIYPKKNKPFAKMMKVIRG